MKTTHRKSCAFGGVRFDIILCMSRFNHVPSGDKLRRDTISSYKYWFVRIPIPIDFYRLFEISHFVEGFLFVTTNSNKQVSTLI